MALEVNRLMAGKVLAESYERVSKQLKTTCPISEVVDLTMESKGCLTYQYILITALVSKLTNPNIDMLSLQIDDKSDGAYAPRSICKEVIFPFQKEILSNALDGSNSDPLVNKPARYLRLEKTNAARGEGRVVLDKLCDSLPTLTTVQDIQATLDYMMSKLVVIARKKQDEISIISNAVRDTSIRDLYKFLSDLLNQVFGGTALVLVAYAISLIQFTPESGYKIIPHPVNQSGTSTQQRSDIDIELNGKPFLGIELKDKPFSSDDVARAAETAFKCGLNRMLFIFGRHAGNSFVPTYFSEVKRMYADKGVTIGVINIDELMDFILVSHSNSVDASQILHAVYDCISAIGATVESQTWVYSRLKSLG